MVWYGMGFASTSLSPYLALPLQTQCIINQMWLIIFISWIRDVVQKYELATVSTYTTVGTVLVRCAISNHLTVLSAKHISNRTI